MDMDKTSPKFKNFNKLPRYLNYDLFFGKLTLNEFGLLLIYVMNADFDSRHKNFGTAYLSNTEVGRIIELDRNKIAKLKDRLISKGYIKMVEVRNGIEKMRIKNFDDDFQTRIDWGLKKIFNDVAKEIDKQS